MIRVGCAGWPLPRGPDARFPAEGTHLERYAAVFAAAEINSTFHRAHRPATFVRWAECVPGGFRFSVKIPKAITHEARLAAAPALLDEFLATLSGLGDKLGCLLVQFPPKLAFEHTLAKGFFEALRARQRAAIAVEPRHASWFSPQAVALLASLGIARVGADPPRAPGGGEPGAGDALAYYRLHGSPRMYYSSYDDDHLRALARRLARNQRAGRESWCIFDNTAGQAAVPNALRLMDLLAGGSELPGEED